MEGVDETQKKQAYLEATRLKKSGLDNEVIYARLEKQGVDPMLIERVLENISVQTIVESNKSREEHYKVQSNAQFIKVGIGVALGVVCYFIFPGNVIIPAGCILMGLALAIIYRSKA